MCGAFVGLLLATAGARPLAGQDTAKKPFRVAIELEANPALKGKEPEDIVASVKKGLADSLTKGTVQVVKGGEPAELVVAVRYKAETISARELVGVNGKVLHQPETLLESLSTTVSGRSLTSSYDSFLTGRFRTQRAAALLGRDIGVVLWNVVLAPAPAATGAPSLNQLVDKLKSRDPVERAQAIFQIAKLGPAGKGAASALLDVLDDDRPLRAVGPGVPTTVGGEAGIVLLNVAAIAELKDFVRSDRDGKIRSRAFDLVVRSGSPDLSDFVMAGLDDRSREVRQSAARAAAPIAGKRAIPKLVEIVGQPFTHVDVRTAARMSLVRLSGQDFGLSGAKWRAWSTRAGGP